MSRNSIYRRTRGVDAFDYTQLELVAVDLGIDVKDIIDSARIGRSA